MPLCNDCLEEADASVEALEKNSRSENDKCSRCGKRLK